MEVSEVRSEQGDTEMLRVLREMLEADETITARAVASRHPHIQYASSITRHSGRRELLARYQAIQDERRGWLKRISKHSRSQTASQMADKDLRIGELEKQIEILRTSHLALIRAVGEMGGMSRWLRFFENYREAREELKALGLLPQTEITMIARSKAERNGPEGRKQ